MASAFKSVASELSLKVQFLKVNTEEEQQLGGQYRIESIPTMVIFEDLKEITRISGALSAPDLQRWIKQYTNG
jgi:thioredoxin 2